MAMDKAIQSGKEHRKPYYRSGRFDRSCRPGGSCPYCRGARLKHTRRNADRVKEQLNDLDA